MSSNEYTNDDRDAFTVALLTDPEGLADAMLDASDEASMSPDGLIGSEIDDYNEASEIAARFIADNVTAMALPVIGGLSAFEKATSQRVAVRTAAARLANKVHAHDKIGDRTKVYHHRLARLAITTTDQETPDLVLYVIELDPRSVLAEGGKKAGALVLYNVTRTFDMTDRETGEIVTLADEGQYRSEALWQTAGIVRTLTAAETDALVADMAWSDDGDRNAAWSFSALRRLTAIAARRNARTEGDPDPEEETDDCDAPF